MLEGLIEKEPTFIPDSSGAGGATAALRNILVAMGLRLPTVGPPVLQPRPVPVAELALELSDLDYHKKSGVRRPVRQRPPDLLESPPRPYKTLEPIHMLLAQTPRSLDQQTTSGSGFKSGA